MSEQRQDRPRTRRIAIVGAGWAGLSAALRMALAGHSVALFEAASSPGGRARVLMGGGGTEQFSLPIDNGQHVLVGAYRHTLSLLHAIGVDPKLVLWRAPLRWRTSNGQIDLNLSRTGHDHGIWATRRRQLAAARAFVLSEGFSLKEKTAIASLILHLRGTSSFPPPITVKSWLRQRGQPATLCRKLWYPLCLATLNTAAAQACAQLFARVLQETLAAPDPRSCDLLLARNDLSAVLPEPALQVLRKLNADLHFNHPVKRVRVEDAGVQVDNAWFDACIIATPYATASRLLGDMTPYAYDFKHLPITTVNLEYAIKPRTALSFAWPYPMLQLRDQPRLGLYGQWIFDRNAVAADANLLKASGAPPTTITSEINVHSYSVVISGSGSHENLSREALAGSVIAQLAEAFPELMQPSAVFVIRDKHATFAATPGLRRPSNATHSPRLWLAGDYTDTGYPATLEGAVCSGERAAQGLLNGIDALPLLPLANFQ